MIEENPVLLKLISFLRATWEDIKNEEVVRQNLIILYVYWVITSGSFVFVPLFNDVQASFPPLINIIWVMGLIVLGIIIITCMVRYFHSNSMRILSLATFIALILLVSCFAGIIFYIQLDRFYFIRIPLLIIAAISFIFLFNFILYSEKTGEIKEENAKNLAQRRYLEYLRSFTWVVVFGLLTFVQIAKDSVGGISGSQHYPRVIWFMQLFIIFFGGILSMLWAFHVKLKEIENQAIKQGKSCLTENPF